MELAEAAQEFLRRRESLLERLERVNAALDAWTEYEADSELPPDLRRHLAPPGVSRRALREIHSMLVEELGRLEGRC